MQGKWEKIVNMDDEIQENTLNFPELLHPTRFFLYLGSLQPSKH